MSKFMMHLPFALLLISSQSIAAEKAVDVCTLENNPPDFASFEKCDSKIVHFSAIMSTQVMQHPTGLHIDFDPEQNTVIRKVENYVDAGDLQIVVTSDKAIECKGKVELTGRVNIVDMGGKSDTKGGYRNPWLRLSDYRCA